MPNILFRFKSGDEIRAHAQSGESILEAAQRAGVAIDAPCGGHGTCGKCRVKLLEGTADAEPSRHLEQADYDKGWRLACCTHVTGDITVAVPDSASAFKNGIHTADLNDPTVRAAFDTVQQELREAGVMGEPAVSTVRITVSEPTLDDTMPDNERVERAVMAETGEKVVKLSLNALKRLALVMRESNYSIRCVLGLSRGFCEILDVFPGDDSSAVCGLAIDIGTTTVTGVLTDMESGALLAKASAGNGQIKYGADVINRIIESARPGGSKRLEQAIVQETLVPLIDSLCRRAGVSQQRIYRVSIAGNTTMNHLLLGLYTDPVRMEPFIPSFFQCDEMKAEDVIPGLNSAAGLVLAPNVGSYVGGDITAGVLATMLWNSEELSLFVDLGTNGELVLGNAEYMMCCACSAGPAFEGGDISCGMRATDGAIESLKIDKETMEPHYTVIGGEGQKPIGICGSGLLDTVAELFITGIIDPRGKFLRQGERVKYDEHGMGRYIIAFDSESGNRHEVSINEVDLDNFIRAKGAIFSAILLLLGQVGLEPADVGTIRIAGGIGGGIDFDNAVRIGMLPDVDRSKFDYIGNSSLSGAYASLLSHEAEQKIRALSKNMMYVELSNEPQYMDEFVSACFLPHTNRNLFPSVEI